MSIKDGDIVLESGAVAPAPVWDRVVRLEHDCERLRDERDAAQAALMRLTNHCDLLVAVANSQSRKTLQRVFDICATDEWHVWWRSLGLAPEKL